MAAGISVIIACYNSEKVIKTTLEHLQNQQNTSGIDWEVLLIDNNCTDNTAAIALETWNKNPIVELKILTEKKIGEANARMLGIKSAKFDILSIVDDDNWVSEKWIWQLTEYYKNQEIGLIGCAGEGVFEEKPPEWFAANQTAFAIGKLAEGDFVDFTSEALVPGAGLSLRKSIYERLFEIGWQPLLQGRVGNTQSAGADSEMCLATRLLGYKIYYSNELTFKHFTSANRISWDRLKKMTAGFGAADVFTLPYIILYREMAGENSITLKIKKNWWLNILGKRILLFLKDPFPYFRKDEYSAKQVYRIRTIAFCNTILENHKKFTQSFSDLEKIVASKIS